MDSRDIGKTIMAILAGLTILYVLATAFLV